MLQRLFQNSISNIGILVLKLAVAFILTPCILQALGKHDYGIYDIVLSVVGYMGMLELGMQPAVTRFIARYAVVDNKERLNRVFSSALIFSTAIGMVIGSVLLGWAFIGAKGLVPQNASSTRYSIFLAIVACQVIVSLPGNVIEAVHHGHQRYWLTNGLNAVNTLIGTTILYIFLKHGFGLLVLSLANAIGITVKFINFYIFLNLGKYGGYKFNLKDVSWSDFRELVSFGLKSFSLGVATKIRNSTDSLVIGAVISPSVVAFYAMPSNLVNNVKNLISAATLGFMPYFSEMNAGGALEKTREAFYISSRYMVALVICFFIGLIFLGTDFLNVWIGPEYGKEGEWILYIIGLSTFLQMLNPFHGRMLTGMNKHGSLAKIRIVEALLNLVISIALCKILGKEGVALGTLLPALIVEPFVLHIACKQIGGTMLEYISQVILPSFVPSAITVLYYYFITTRCNLNGYTGIFTVGFLGSAFFVFFFILFLREDERNRFFHAVRRRNV